MTRLSAHLAAGHRLRQLTRVAPPDSVAVLSPAGRLLHARRKLGLPDRRALILWHGSPFGPHRHAG